MAPTAPPAPSFASHPAAAVSTRAATPHSSHHLQHGQHLQHHHQHQHQRQHLDLQHHRHHQPQQAHHHLSQHHRTPNQQQQQQHQQQSAGAHSHSSASLAAAAAAAAAAGSPHATQFAVPLDLGGLDGSDAVFASDLSRFAGSATSPDHQHLQYLAGSPTAPHHPGAPHHQLQQQQQHHQVNGRLRRVPPQGQFGVLTATPAPPRQNASLGRTHGDDANDDEDVYGDGGGGDGGGAGGSAVAFQNLENKPHGQLTSKIVVDPPNLDEWREKLFNVDETITLTHDEFETYFPHIDNVYSHRSTQKYKKKPFISHYWDCRMKGRPPGTPKSDDPAKKKRKRRARERDLCDVKIKITEYFPDVQGDFENAGAITPEGFAAAAAAAGQMDGLQGMEEMAHLVSSQRFWTIQRVNGNGGNGKSDGVAGPHKHSLQKSDEIKKNTVQRYLAQQEKGVKKTQKIPVPRTPAIRKPAGTASLTAKKHSREADLKLFAAPFCPFSQRVWIALEAKGLPYQYCEINLHDKPRPTQLLEANPRGLVPAIRQGDWAIGESSVILEYFEDVGSGVPLYPTDSRLKANCRLWIDHINSAIVPSFFALLDCADPSRQAECRDRLHADIENLVLAADEEGPFFYGADLCLVDVHFAPFALRLSRILQPLRGWAEAMPGTRLQRWLDALENQPSILATTGGRDLYSKTVKLLLQGRGSI